MSQMSDFIFILKKRKKKTSSPAPLVRLSLLLEAVVEMWDRILGRCGSSALITLLLLSTIVTASDCRDLNLR